jgi:hypothetical protein
VRHINPYPVFPSGYRKKESGFGPLSGPLIEKYDARAVFDPHDFTVAGNPWGVPNFLWINGDGTGATIGPAGLNLAVTGTVTPNQPTPHQYPNGTDALIERYAGASYRLDLVRRLSPTASNDIVVAAKWRYFDLWSSGFIFSNTYNGSGVPGFGLSLAGGYCYGWQVNAAGHEHSAGTVTPQYPRTMNCGLMVMNRDGNLHSCINGELDSTATLLGDMTGNGIAIGCKTNSTYIVPAGFGVEWIAVWYADGLYETWSADSSRLMLRLNWESLGLRETVTNSKYWAYSQVGGGSGNVSGRSYKDHNDRWWFSGERVPRAGNPNGCVVSPYTSNLAVTGVGGIRNYNPSVITGWTVSGGAFTVAADVAALAAVKAETWGPNVYSFANATGVPQVVIKPASPIAGRIAHFMVLGRYVAGANALIGWWDVSAATFTSVGTILDNYAITAIYNQTAVQADWQFAIQVPDGCTLLFIGQALILNTTTYGSIITYPPPNAADPWSNEAKREILTTQHTPVVGSGSYLVNLAPLAWSGTACGTDNSVLPCVTTPGDILHAESAAPGWATSDGTVQIATGAPTAGVYVDVWTAWKAALQYIQQGLVGVATVGAYDGAKGTAGALTAAPTILGGDFVLKYIEIRNVA